MSESLFAGVLRNKYSGPTFCDAAFVGHGIYLRHGIVKIRDRELEKADVRATLNDAANIRRRQKSGDRAAMLQ
jgi:uncharacterized protein (UPF0254 family)